jgi:hypothetical protein
MIMILYGFGSREDLSIDVNVSKKQSVSISRAVLGIEMIFGSRKT